jgi:hypothetical protein
MAHEAVDRLYRVRALTQTPSGWQATLHLLDNDGKAIRQERRIWHCLDEGKPRLVPGQTYTMYQLANAVTPSCTQIETVVETISG